MKFNLKSPREVEDKFTTKMYQGKRKILRLDEYNERRKEIVSDKDGAVWTTFVELEGIINQSALVKQYFKKSQSWFAQRVNGCTVRDTEAAFKEDEYHQLADAFRDIAKRLQVHADEIDAAKFE